MKDFNGYYRKTVTTSLRKVQVNEAYFAVLDYKRERIDAAWSKLKPTLSKNWSPKWFDRSLVVRNDKLGVVLKITMTNEIFMDKRISKFDYKSEKHTFETIDEAILKFESSLLPYKFSPSVAQSEAA